MKIKQHIMTEEILKIILQIDKTFYTDFDYDLDWYKERYLGKNLAYLLYDKNTCVGYVVCVGVRSNLYRAFKNGVLRGDYDINPNMFVENSKYNYLSSIVILEKYRQKGYGKKLLKTVFENVIGNIVCLTISDEGFNLVHKNMKQLHKIDEKTYVFER